MIYPIALKLAGRKAVVVGGGAVALQKVRTLLPARARITVVSPAFDPRLRRIRGVTLCRKRFSPADLRGAFVAIGAADDPRVNAAVARAARRRGILVNVVDTPDLCDFYVPSVFRRGALAIAVSTAGESPGLSRRIRLELERLYGRGFGGFLRHLAGRRRELIEGTADPRERRKVLARMTSEPVLARLRRNGVGAARRAMDRVLARATGRAPLLM